MKKKTPEERRAAYNAYQKAYRQRNRENLKAKRRVYYEANREQIVRRQIEWNQKNSEKNKVKRNAYYQANRELLMCKQLQRYYAEKARKQQQEDGL